jgi:hypothetical protein
LVVVVYVIVVMWLVSSNFKSAEAASKASAARGTGFLSSIVEGFLTGVYRQRKGGGGGGIGGGGVPGDGEADTDDLIETEALLVLQDEEGKKKPRCTTNFEDEFEGEPV